jgi:hypothetical protein
LQQGRQLLKMLPQEISPYLAENKPAFLAGKNLQKNKEKNICVAL